MLFSPSGFKPPELGNYWSRATALTTGAGSGRASGGGSCRRRAPRGELASYFAPSLHSAEACMPPGNGKHLVPCFFGRLPWNRPTFLCPRNSLFVSNRTLQNLFLGRLTAGVKKQLLKLMFLPPTSSDGCALPRQSERHCLVAS